MEFLSLRLTFLSLFCLLFLTIPAWGNLDPVLELHFFKSQKDCHTLKNYLYLNKEKKELFEQKLGQKIDSAIFRRYELRCLKRKGSVYIVNGLVRSHYMTLLVYAEKELIKNIEVVSFTEPSEYRPKEGWIKSLEGKSFSNNIDVDGISGATLTTQTTKNLLNQVKIMENYFHDKK
jgi:hypothetical protein